MQALFAAVSNERQEAVPPDGGGFPAALAEAAELSRRCAGGPAEAVAALQAALARCDPAHLAAHTDVDTPLLLNTLLAAAQGIPVAKVRSHHPRAATMPGVQACARLPD